MFFILFLTAGIFLTAHSRGNLFTLPGKLSHIPRAENSKQQDTSGFSSFQSLCTALSSTLGTGNIAGVATAIALGGPGAIFWMWISSLFGITTHYYEVYLGMKYQKQAAVDHTLYGGAMYYIRDGLGASRLAAIFAFFTVLASFGVGNSTQANAIADILFSGYRVPKLFTGSVLAFLAALVILGGQKRIAQVTQILIPFMAGGYLLLSCIFLGFHITALPKALSLILTCAFHSYRTVTGGLAGYTVLRAMNFGISRGVYTNEAGMGSSVTAHAASTEKEPMRQGCVAIFELFFDTMIMCSITAFVILVSGAYDMQIYHQALLQGKIDLLPNAASLTNQAFSTLFGTAFSTLFISVSLILFAFSTFLGWSYYGQRAAIYLWGEKAVLPYQLLFFVVIIVGSTMNLNLIWQISDQLNLFMALPNLYTIIRLRNQVESKVSSPLLQPHKNSYTDQKDRRHLHPRKYL